MPEFLDTMTLAEARDLLRTLVDDGHACPCCTQMARVYQRPMTAVAARAVVALWREHRHEFGHMPTVARQHAADVAHQGGYLVLAAHWGLIEPETAVRGDQGRAGYWRVTPAGEQWAHGRSTVEKYARLYDGRCLGHTGPAVTVLEVLGTGFDLNELLGTPPAEMPPAQLFTLGAAA